MIALFVPCYVDLFWPKAAIATVNLFERLGVRFEYPPQQTCCGQPAFNAGLWDEARPLAERFAKVFAGYETIVVPSGSCAAMCSTFYRYMDAGAAFADIGARVCDLATFLVERLGVVHVGARFSQRVTYLDGCHGRRELGCTEAAVKLLRAVRGLDYVELPNVEECCGFGGAFAVKFPQLSASMGAAKCSHVQETGAAVLTSGDASCLLHVRGLLERAGSSVRAMHLAEILAQT